MKLTLTKPDDWHIHLREGTLLATTVRHAAERFQRALVMPNLTKPVCNVKLATEYHRAIMDSLPPNSTFEPLMTLYLTQQTTPQEIEEAKRSGLIFGCKLYPAFATTHSESGVTDIKKLYPVFEKMQEINLPLLIHGEVVDPSIDIFDREAIFIDTHLTALVKTFPQLRIVLEHITTKDATEFIASASPFIAATITVHHLLLNRNDLLVGGIKPHYYCLPILKSRHHQEALLKAAISGSPKYFLGTDSAPHAIEKKETACGCAGVYTAHAAIELCAEVFEQANALDKLEAFTGFYGADFYQLPRNTSKIELSKVDWQVPSLYSFGNSNLIPLRAGQTIRWKLNT
jgi:dihydroorotase